MYLFNIFKEESIQSKEKKVFKNFLKKLNWEHDNKSNLNSSEGLEKILGVYYCHHDRDAYKHSDSFLINNVVEIDDGSSALSSIEFFIEETDIQDLKLDKLKIQQWKHDYMQEVSSKGPFKLYTSDDWYTSGRKFSVYKIDFNDFIEKVCTEEQKQIYQEVKDSLSTKKKFKLKM